MPFFRGSGFVHTALGGWQVSGITVAQTGLPFRVTLPADNASVANGAGTSSRPDMVGNPHATPAPDGNRGPLLYNPAAYAAPQGLTFGDVGRNTLYLPSGVNFDFGAYKKFQIKEKAAFEFRWENYDLFKHTQFDGLTPSNLYSSVFGSSTFLHPTNTHDPRRMQFGLPFYF